MRYLTPLFKAQAELDGHITTKKGLEGVNLLDERILAFNVELAECAQETRAFKFWSENQKPNTRAINLADAGLAKIKKGIITDLEPYVTNPLLEEYVDGLHFLLSIGNEIGCQDIIIDADYTKETTTQTFNAIYSDVTALTASVEENALGGIYVKDHYEILFNRFIGLGEQHFEFTWDEIEKAYYAKHEVNYERQANGY